MSEYQNEGLALGHAMAEVAAENAGAGWQDEAYDAFVRHANTHETFTTEEVRLANTNLPCPPDTRAWGAVARRAAREGIVQSVGWTRAKSLKVHGMVVTKWEKVK
jgi:hypothetical protein